MTDPLLPKSIAYHEAGHVVVAAVLGRRLSRHGVHVDCADRGIAFYDQRWPPGYFNSPKAGTKVDTIVAARAGLFAQRHFYPNCPVNCAEGDEDQIQKLLAFREDDDPPDLASEGMQAKLTEQAGELVKDRRNAIEGIAEELWAAPCGGRKYCEPYTGWSTSKMEKTLDGLRLQQILKRFGIQALIWDPAPFGPRPVAE